MCTEFKQTEDGLQIEMHCIAIFNLIPSEHFRTVLHDDDHVFSCFIAVKYHIILQYFSYTKHTQVMSLGFVLYNRLI